MMMASKVYEDVLISLFDSKGLPLYVFKEGSQNYWHIWSYPNYLDFEDEDDRPSRRKNEKKSIKQRYDEEDPTVSPLGETSSRFDYLVNYSTSQRHSKFTLVPLSLCKPIKPDINFALASPTLPVIAMYKPPTSYESEFFPLKERTINQTRFMYQAKNPVGIDAKGRLNTITQGEAILNWQSKNALA